MSDLRRSVVRVKYSDSRSPSFWSTLFKYPSRNAMPIRAEAKLLVAERRPNFAVLSLPA